MFEIFWFKKDDSFSSILHLNTPFIAIFNLNVCGILSSIIISLSHGLSSVSLSVLVGFLINKTYPRYLDPCYFINTQLRCLLLFMLPTNLSFPITINFFGEILTLVAIVSMDIYFRVLSILSNYISTLFWLLILNRKWHQHSYSSFSYIQLLILYWLCVVNLVRFYVCF